MVKPVKKLKKILLTTGIAGAVYGGFKYLLPLVIPFLLAYAAALWLRPSVRFFESRIRLKIMGKERKIPAGVIGGAELTILAAGVVWLGYLGGKQFLSEAGMFLERFPLWLESLDRWLTEGCRSAEQALGLRSGYLVERAGEMVAELGRVVKQSTMPALMTNSMTLVKKAAEALVFIIIFFVAAILCIQEMDDLREKKSRSDFHREYSLLGRRLVTVGNAWLKSQLIIMTVTSGLCILGLLLIRNPYAVLFGTGIGLLDALPVFGTGTVLIPWGMILLAGKQWGKAAVILGLYVLCYFLRQIMEARIMGDQVGLSPLETLASMYVGLRLFGIAGFLLGPIGYILIEDLTDMYREND